MDTQGGNRMRESCTYGSVRGVRGTSARRLHDRSPKTSWLRASTPVHHRLLAFPMRTAVRESELSIKRPDVGYPSFRRDPFARDVLLDPDGMTAGSTPQIDLAWVPRHNEAPSNTMI